MSFWPFGLFVGILFCMQGYNVLSQVVGERPVSFCAVRSSNLTSGSTVLPFTSVPLNDSDAFDLASNSFTVPANSSGGYFWLTWSIGIPPSLHADVRLMGKSRSPNIIRQHSAFTSGVDTTSRTELVYLEPTCDTLTLSTNFGLFSDAGWQTSFCGFSLFSTMSEVVAFNFGKSTTTTSSGTLVYDMVNVDTHAGYSTATGQYTVKKEGVYVVSFSVASVAGTVLDNHSRVRLCLVSSYLAAIYFLETGEDMATQSILVDAAVGQTMYTYLDHNPPAYSDIYYQTSLMGFLYNPTRSLPYVWSVASEIAHTSAIDPVPFDITFVSLGGGWSMVTNTYTVQAAGVYYIHLTAGIYWSYPCKLELLVNDVASVNVYRQSNQHAALDTSSRAFILRLAEGDVLRVRLPSGYATYSDSTRVTTFSGFRLYD